MADFVVCAAEFLPDERLRELTKSTELSTVRQLTFSVDTSENSLGDLGHRLPALQQLRLDGSNISTLRDLGTGLGGLSVLWLGRSGLHELEGFGSFGALTELYLAFNEVEDLSPLMGAERLQVLDLEANAVRDPAQVHYLASCDQLQALTLEGNPIAEPPEYRQQVLLALPQLCSLDDEPVGRLDGAARDTTPTLGAAALVGGAADASSPQAERRFAAVAAGAPAEHAAPAAGALPSLPPVAGVSAEEASARRREERLVRDGIKYADALRAYDVQSHEALEMGPESASALSLGLSPSRGSSASSSRVGGGGGGLKSHAGGDAHPLKPPPASAWGGSATSECSVSTAASSYVYGSAVEAAQTSSMYDAADDAADEEVGLIDSERGADEVLLLDVTDSR